MEDITTHADVFARSTFSYMHNLDIEIQRLTDRLAVVKHERDVIAAAHRAVIELLCHFEPLQPTATQDEEKVPF